MNDPKYISDQDALAALKTLRAWLGLGSSSPTVYTADQLPPDATSRDAYLRRHRERMKARTPGWTRSGRVRAVTAEAWAADVARESTAAATRPRLAVVQRAPSVDDEIDRALGIRLRSR